MLIRPQDMRVLTVLLCFVVNTTPGYESINSFPVQYLALPTCLQEIRVLTVLLCFVVNTTPGYESINSSSVRYCQYDPRI